jgi:ligand-binding SRPBCC domain-containing protein
MSASLRVEVTSHLAAPAARVWADVSTMAGVNQELMPLVRMTSPATARSLRDVAAAPGSVAFHSWLLLGGVLPIDRHALSFESFDDGRGFVEESTSWLQRRWRHERTVVELSEGSCTVTDRVLVEPRVAVTCRLVGAVVSRVFRHRHRRLVERFGTPCPVED